MLMQTTVCNCLKQYVLMKVLSIQHLSILSNELEAGRQYAVKEGTDEDFVRGIDCRWQSIEPGQHKRLPA